jgi:NAD-dependent DNA ligase
MRDFLDKACIDYYEGRPQLTDEEFDLLAEKHQYNKVGYQVTDAVPHTYRMYSLKKCFDLDEAPLPIEECIETPKLDGAAVSLLYVAGFLQLALTRGDGIQGRDITDKMRLLVPDQISMTAMVQITGEVVAPSSIPNARNYAAGSLNLKDHDEFFERSKELWFVAYGQEKVVNRNYDATLEGLERRVWKQL